VFPHATGGTLAGAARETVSIGDHVGNSPFMNGERAFSPVSISKGRMLCQCRPRGSIGRWPGPNYVALSPFGAPSRHLLTTARPFGISERLFRE
jgi:hypothetical protein